MPFIHKNLAPGLVCLGKSQRFLPHILVVHYLIDVGNLQNGFVGIEAISNKVHPARLPDDDVQAALVRATRLSA